MSNILMAKVEIEGIKPFLYQAFGRESIPLQKGEGSYVDSGYGLMALVME